MQSSPSNSARMLSRQLDTMGAEVLDVTPEDFQAKPMLFAGDVLVIDAGQSSELTSQTLEAMQSHGCSVPVVVMQAMHSAATELENVVTLNKPVGRMALLAAISSFAPPQAAPLPQPDDIAPPEPIPIQTRKMRILAAEDNRTNRLVFGKLVGKLNVDLEFAEDGAEAVEKWQSFQPDMIFMDISMPIMDGKQATRKIRALETEKGHHTPIIALTADAIDGDDTEVLDAGLDHYLTKPLRKAKIFEQIKAAVPDVAAAVFEAESGENP